MKSRALSLSLVPLAALAFCAPSRAASAPDPGDYVPAPAGATVTALYAQQQKADRVYEGGRRVAGDLGLKLDIGVLRVMHYFELGGKPADLELVLPFGRQRIGGDDTRLSGLGNVILGTTYWTHSDEASQTHLGWAGYLTVPTGEHRSEGFFASENRYALDLQFGYITPLAPKVSLDLLGQTELYTRDDTTRIERKPLVRAFAHLSWHLSDTTRLAFSVRQAFGARETLDGHTVLGNRRDTNLMLTWQHQVSDALQLQLQVAKDVKVRNGAAVQALQARVAYVF
jgi:hypothetical protein